MSKLHIKTGDTVKLLTGDKEYRGKTGKVLEVSPKEGKVREYRSGSPSTHRQSERTDG